ncbi:MAG TPA: dethiobiotin synthase [Candidatus Binatia bacterium]
MACGIFITGTDTGVGKTLVSCSVAALLRDLGYRVGVMKPVETGCSQRNGELFPEDAVRLKQASGCDEPMEKICPYRFAEPLAPSIAAERGGERIDIDRLLQVYHEISSGHDVTLVEGAGGLMVPLLPSFTYADFGRTAKLPLIVVAANRLGAINHLMLTLEHAQCKGLSVIGYVLNCVTDQNSLASDTNREVLANLTGVPCLAELTFVPTATSEGLIPAQQFERGFALWLIKPFLL